MIGFGVSQAIRFGSNLFMTRMLIPELFGVMAIATTVMFGLAMFSDVGLRQSVIRSNRGTESAFLNTAWLTQVLRGALIWVIALGVSLLVVFANRIGVVPANSVYSEPSLPYVIAILSFSAVISGFDSTKLFEASRNLLVGAVTQIEIISQLAGLSCMIAWVVLDRSIWALVSGSICSTLVRVILSHIVLPGVANRWQWDHAAFREILGFGKWIFLSSILGFLVSSGDRLLLGGLLSTSELGVYVIAFLLVNSVEQVLSRIIGGVSFPALSEVAHQRPTEMKVSYYRFRFVLGTFANFCVGFLMVAGQTLVGLLYDRRYSEAGWMVETLAACLMTVPFSVAIQCFMVFGAPKLLPRISMIRLVTMFLLMPSGFHFFGLKGALWGFVISYYSSLTITIYYKMTYKLFDFRKELLMLPSVLVGAYHSFFIGSAQQKSSQ